MVALNKMDKCQGCCEHAQKYLLFSSTVLSSVCVYLLCYYLAVFYTRENPRYYQQSGGAMVNTCHQHCPGFSSRLEQAFLSLHFDIVFTGLAFLPSYSLSCWFSIKHQPLPPTPQVLPVYMQHTCTYIELGNRTMSLLSLIFWTGYPICSCI